MIRLATAALAAALLAAATAQADIRADCIQAEDIPRSIAGCSAVIESGNWSGSDLAVAYFNRGNGYRRSGQFQRAVDDYDASIGIDSSQTQAFVNRGLAYCQMGNRDGFLRDVGHALGSDREEATRFQTLLKRDGFYNGTVDGSYGPATEQALLNFARQVCNG